ncbi:Sodium/potassium/calcium exchanger 1 [Frankliniella fusca]|uniref:Sodium/potassium/calcium exchanger 1 n=1 Tax=Frankliniella fusca TaxID=407009 RepID=A0AAE1LSN6_9NEOP|nr:Sodium/potassium/calcium exchanger 1 [Frankliniella fusca]
MPDSDSDSDDQPGNRQPQRIRYRKRKRDQTFKRRQVDHTSSSSEPESNKRFPLNDSDDSNHSNIASEMEGHGDFSNTEGSVENASPDEQEHNNADDVNADNGIILPQECIENFEECEEEERESGEREERESGEEEESEEHVGEEEEDEEQEEAPSEAGDGERVESEASGHSEGSDQEGDSDVVGEEEEEDEEENFDIHDNRPLYNGARITLKQSATAILTFALTHNLSGVCIDDLLSLISLHCGPDNLCIKSLHLFKKYFAMLGQEHIVRHYYCSVCESLLPSKDSLCATCAQNNLNRNEENEADPDNPDANENENKSKALYFIEFSLTRQLQNLYKRPGFIESLQFKTIRVKKNLHNIEDLYDGNMYLESTDEGFLSNPNNISFTMYFDGVSIFKSAKFSIWPIYLSINELKYKDRIKKENVIIAGLWFGKTKPNPNLFLKPLWDKMQVFQNNGVELRLPNAQIVRVKGRVLIAVGDLPAKALFMRLIQYNGSHSCFCCLSSGAQLEVGPRSSVHVFPYVRNLLLRQNAEMQDFADQAVIARQTDPKAVVYGVKGPTLMSAFLPDLIRCMAIDPMHGIFLGLTKTLMNLWFSTEYSGYPFSICGLIDIVDDRLKKIKPPDQFQRVPRSIKLELALFKASDYKNMFFYFSVVVLLGILPDPYWEHHCKVVSAVALLSQESVSPEEIDTADELLHMYVRDFEGLYGLRYMGLNVHQLLHLSMNVKNLGPLWVYSCFTFESLNGGLSRLVHGTRHAALQICSSSYVCLKLSELINRMNECEAKSLCLQLMNRGAKKVKISEVVNHETSVVDRCKTPHRVPRWIKVLLEEDLNIVGGRIQFFMRLKKKANVYCSEEYLRSQRKLSCFVEVFHNNIPYLCKIKYFVRWSSCNQNCPNNCLECPKRFLCINELYDRVPWRLQELGQNITIPFLDRVVPSGVRSAYTVESIRSPCLYMMVDQDEYICTPLNSLEIE